MRVLFLIIFLFSSPFVFGQNAAETEILKAFKHKETVVYKMVDGASLNMDIFYPDSAKMQEKNPWMIHVHGGGWAGGSKFNILKPPFLTTLHTLVDSGVVCVSIEYRKARGNSNAYDAVVDAKDATRFLLKNAKKFKLDKERYGIWGGSAGGHLSLVTALGADSYFQGDSQLSDISTRYKCVVSYFPFTSCLNPDLRPGSIFEDESLFVRLLGAPLKEKPELARLLSPTELLKSNSSPILLIHGDKDETLPIKNSLYMMEVAKKKKADVQLLSIKNAGHSFKGTNISPSMKELNDYSAKYILSHLKDKAQSNSQINDGFVKLFNGKNWDGWHLKLRNGDEDMAKKVYAIEDGMVHVFKDFPDSIDVSTGVNGTHGLFYTNKKYSKYILRFQYKWGKKIANNFDKWQYDAGVYYHVVDDKVWPTGIEFQIRYDHTKLRNHTGDLIRPKGADYTWYCDEESKTYLHPNDGGKPEVKRDWMHLATPTKNYNALNDKWNQCEIIVMGTEYVIYKLNEDVVNVAFNLSPGEGILGFQSETAEIYYQNIEIKEFDEIIPIEQLLGK